MIKLVELLKKRRMVTAVEGVMIIAVTATLFLTAEASIVDSFAKAQENSSGEIIISYDYNYEDNTVKSFTVTDQNTIQKLDEYKNNDTIRQPTADEVLDGTCKYWIAYDDGTVIGLYGELDWCNFDYGNIGIKTDIETEAKSRFGEEIILPKGISLYVESLIETYKQSDSLLEKYNLKIGVGAWNDYAPGGGAPTGPRPNFVVSFTAARDTAVPDISVSVKIASAKNTIDIPLSADNTSLNWYKTFRVHDAQQIGMVVGEQLTAVITITIGDEKQTFTFYPIVKATH